MCELFDKILYLLILNLFILISFSYAQETQVKEQNRYDSRYLVFGFKNIEEVPCILALDFNRTFVRSGKTIYEYKGFIGKGIHWKMFLYESWTADNKEDKEMFVHLPSIKNLNVKLADDNSLDVDVNQNNVRFKLKTDKPDFLFKSSTKSRENISTSHVNFELEYEGETYKGTGVYEWVDINKSKKNSVKMNEEESRNLDDGSTFGFYNWIVLYDEKGKVWQISQGTLIDDFGYHLNKEGSSSQTDLVYVWWTKTRQDKKSNLETPEEWLVDVPEWNFRVKLKALGEHRGYGSERGNGIIPVYRQVGVEGEGIVNGKMKKIFGMVELIQD